MENLIAGPDLNQIAAGLLESAAQKIAARVKEAGADAARKLMVESSAAFRKYLRGALERYGKVKTILYRDAPKPLYDFYESCYVAERPPRGGARASRLISTEEVSALLERSPFLLLLGAGGVGKSTLMKHLFLSALRRRDRIPLYLELKDLNEGGLSLRQLISRSLKRFGFSLEEKYIDYALRSGCFLLLLDGFDEVAGERYPAALGELALLADEYPDNGFIVSSRPGGTLRSLERFTALYLQPFTQAQSVSLIRRLDYAPDVRERFARALEAGLYAEQQSFASNPLLLTIMLLTFENYADIPDKLHVFYGSAFDTLYFRHDATKSGYARRMHSGLSYDAFKKALGRFCFRSYIRERFLFRYGELVGYFSGEGCPPEGMIRDLLESVCVLVREGDRYLFTHRSFQEYFAALCIAELPDEQQKQTYRFLINRSGMRFDDRVLDLLAEMSPDRFERNALLPLLERLEGRLDARTDRYDAFFDEFFIEVDFELDPDEEEYGATWALDSLFAREERGLSAGERAFLWQAARRYAPDEGGAEGRLNSRIVGLLYGFGELHDPIEVGAEELRACPAAYALFRETWMGRRLLTLSTLCSRLRDGARDRGEALERLLGLG